MGAHPRPLTRGAATRRAVIIIAAVTAATSAIAAGVILNIPPELDKDMCPVGRPPASSVVMVIDTTDALTPEDQRRLLTKVREVRDGVPRYGKLTLVLVDPAHPYAPTERISLCNPGSPSQLGMLFHTPRKVEKRWKESFEGPVDAVAAELAAAPKGAISPIIQTMTGVSWRSDFKSAVVPDRRIIWFSDMRHFTPADGLSLYAAGDPWASFLKSPLARNAPDLAGVTVEIELLHRPDAPLSEDALRAFWMNWLRTRAHAAKAIIDGKETELNPLPGKSS